MMAELTYADKLRDPRWQKKRLEVLQRENFTCEKCHATDKTLHVHHGYYSKGMDPWEYLSSTLHCLCEQCHEEIQEYTRDLYYALAFLPVVRLQSITYVIMHEAANWLEEKQNISSKNEIEPEAMPENH